MNTGWIYCISNPSFPGLLKIGGTWSPEKTPDVRAKELYTTGVPAPFKVEFAKLVSDPKKKETTLHQLLEQYDCRHNPNREFFRISPEEVMTFFDLMEGTMWENKKKLEDEDEDEDEEEINSNIVKKGCRDISKCFTNGQNIRHTIGINKTWIGVYDASRNGIIFDAKFYKSLSGFANAHHLENGTYKHKGVSGWGCTDCKINELWVSTSNLSEI